MRKEPLVTGHVYHVCTKSIAGYGIFRSDSDYKRMLEMMRYYSFEDPPMKFSAYRRLEGRRFLDVSQKLKERDRLVNILAYCIMPTHLHLVLHQMKENGISLYMKNLLNSYTRYFNTRNHRKGPLWQGRFRSVLVRDSHQLLHLTRYIHLNPTSDNLVDRPEDWPYSSYREYLSSVKDGLCEFSEFFTVSPETYREFVETRKDYQSSLSKIKYLLLE